MVTAILIWTWFTVYLVTYGVLDAVLPKVVALPASLPTPPAGPLSHLTDDALVERVFVLSKAATDHDTQAIRDAITRLHPQARGN